VSEKRSVVAPTIQGSRVLLSDTFHTDKTIEFATRRFPSDNGYSIFLPDLVEDTIEPIPRFHQLSAYHYKRYQESAYREYFSYSQFCVLEEHVADIVFLYLNDTRNRWLVLLDPAFLYSDSVRSYGTTEAVKKTVWVSPSAAVGDPDFILWKPPSDRPPL
jgi:hypothetical protein